VAPQQTDGSSLVYNKDFGGSHSAWRFMAQQLVSAVWDIVIPLDLLGLHTGDV
jgi:hypothetical protein